MGRNASSAGMMEGAFFVSRSELLQWVNGLLQINLTKVEQCAGAAVYCQLIDACKPGTVAMRKINWMAKADHEYIPNYKVLQVAFDKNGIQKHIDVDKLIRAKYQDNLEFLQWMKCYWEREGGPGLPFYDAVQAREGKQLPVWARPAGGVVPAPTSARAGEKENLRPSTSEGKRNFGGASPVSTGAPKAVAGKTPRSNSVSRGTGGGYRAADADDSGMVPGLDRGREEELHAKIVSQREELNDLHLTLEGLEKERDYYFRKLRDVEILCTTLEAKMDPEMTSSKLVSDVLGILYADAEQEEG